MINQNNDYCCIVIKSNSKIEQHPTPAVVGSDIVAIATTGVTVVALVGEAKTSGPFFKIGVMQGNQQQGKVTTQKATTGVTIVEELK